MVERKRFFTDLTAADIRSIFDVRKAIPARDAVDTILGFHEAEAGIIRDPLVPAQFRDARHFLKHGPEVRLRAFRSLEEAVHAHRTPVQLRAEAFNRVQADVPYSSYSFTPFLGRERLKRRVALTECLEGARIYCYANQSSDANDPFAPRITIQPYTDAKQVERDGAEIITLVPSRMKGQRRYLVHHFSIPIENTAAKWGLAYRASAKHHCGSKDFNRIRYTGQGDREGSLVIHPDAHEIAGRFQINDYFVQPPNRNLVPLEQSPFAIPTQETVRFYTSLCNRVLIQPEGAKDPRKLNQAEREILLWGLVRKLGHDATFYATEKLRGYNWKI